MSLGRLFWLRSVCRVLTVIVSHASGFVEVTQTIWAVDTPKGHALT